MSYSFACKLGEEGFFGGRGVKKSYRGLIFYFLDRIFVQNINLFVLLSSTCKTREKTKKKKLYACVKFSTFGWMEFTSKSD